MKTRKEIAGVKEAGIGHRLRRQRETVGMSVKGLADLVGLSRNTVSNYEAGKTEPSVTELVKIAKALGCGIMELVEGAEPVRPRFAFRAHKKLRKDPGILASARKYLQAYREIEEITETKLVPRIRHFDIDPESEDADKAVERAADYTRKACGLSDWGPERIAHVLESLGIRCLFFDWERPGLDAISVVEGDMILVMIHRPESVVERTIMSAAHELGHLVLHPELFTPVAGEEPNGRDYEKEAILFAGCFLVPSEHLVRVWQDERLDRLPLERALVLLKRVFRVSFWALYERVRQAGLAEMEYRYMVQKVKRIMGIYGRAKKQDLEPARLPVEALEQSTRFERLVCSAFLQEKIGIAKVAELLQITVDEAKERTAEWMVPEGELVE